MFIGGGGIPLGIDPDDEFYGIDWSKIDKPVKLTVTERVDIDNLQAFAGSEEGKKEISTFYPEEEDNDNNEDQLDNVFDGKSAREIIFIGSKHSNYLRQLCSYMNNVDNDYRVDYPFRFSCNNLLN